jgi:hypothetical protein
MELLFVDAKHRDCDRGLNSRGACYGTVACPPAVVAIAISLREASAGPRPENTNEYAWEAIW